MTVMTQATEESFDQFVANMNQLMDQLLHKSFFRFRPTQRWQPAINLYEADDRYCVCVDLAGVDPKQVDVQVEGRQLRISGQRTAPAIAHKCAHKIHVMEIDHGPFQRNILLPEDVDINQIEAQYKDGFLWIQLPRKQ